MTPVFRHRVQRGMTLIEVLVAVLIFSFGLLGLVGLQGRAHTIALSGEDTNRAALLANEIVAAVVLAPVAATTPGSSPTIGNVDAAYWNTRAGATVPNGSVVLGALQGGNKRLPITIYWKSPTATAAAASNVYTTEAILP